MKNPNPNRYYWRGTTPLGILNIISGCLFNVVLVKARDIKTGKTVRLYWDRADNHPPIRKRNP